MKKCGMRYSREKGAGMRDHDPPPPFQPWSIRCIVPEDVLFLLVIFSLCRIVCR